MHMTILNMINVLCTCNLLGNLLGSASLLLGSASLLLGNLLGNLLANASLHACTLSVLCCVCRCVERAACGCEDVDAAEP